MTSRNFGVKLTPSPSVTHSHFVTNLAPRYRRDVTSLQPPTFKKANDYYPKAETSLI